jgi:hypothetical protein
MSNGTGDLNLETSEREKDMNSTSIQMLVPIGIDQLIHHILLQIKYLNSKWQE